MTRVVLPEAKIFKEIIDAISNLADEISIVLNPDGMVMRAMDVDQSSLLEVNFPKDMFLEYEVEEPQVIGVSVGNLKKVLKHLKKGENLTIIPEGDYVKFSIGEGGVSARRFRFRNLEVTTPQIPELELQFTVSAQIMTQALKKALEDIEEVGGSAEFNAKEEALIVRAVGVGRVEVRFAKGSLATISLEVKEPASAVYDAAKLTNILSVTKISDIVKLEFASKMPLKAEFIVGSGKVTYLLAPFETA
ncbi:MAG: DNA polymerase sliding clamp [Desulfurococcaceae archaeon]|nr:DNA polymerase sliding clamp [Desulfurococcaceae archaeon]